MHLLDIRASSSPPRLPLCQIVFLWQPPLLSQPMEKNRILNQSLTHRAYLMPRELKLLLQNKSFLDYWTLFSTIYRLAFYAVVTCTKNYYPSIRSIWRDTKFTVPFFLSFLCTMKISQPGLYRSEWNFTLQFGHISDKFSPIWGDSPRYGRMLGVNMRGWSIFGALKQPINRKWCKNYAS